MKHELSLCAVYAAFCTLMVIATIGEAWHIDCYRDNSATVSSSIGQ